jgi:hypothetical protein
MSAVEFTVELNGRAGFTVPDEVAAQLPKTGKARVIVLTEDDAEEAGWRQATYDQFLRDDVPQDSIYDFLT